jgi:hypothetical protein
VVARIQVWCGASSSWSASSVPASAAATPGGVHGVSWPCSWVIRKVFEISALADDHLRLQDGELGLQPGAAGPQVLRAR